MSLRWKFAITRTRPAPNWSSSTVSGSSPCAKTLLLSSRMSNLEWVPFLKLQPTVYWTKWEKDPIELYYRKWMSIFQLTCVCLLHEKKTTLATNQMKSLLNILKITQLGLKYVFIKLMILNLVLFLLKKVFVVYFSLLFWHIVILPTDVVYKVMFYPSVIYQWP